jgi:hypothetical protein
MARIRRRATRSPDHLNISWSDQAESYDLYYTLLDLAHEFEVPSRLISNAMLVAREFTHAARLNLLPVSVLSVWCGAFPN